MITKEEIHLRYRDDREAKKNGYYDYELWLEERLIEAHIELSKLHQPNVSGRSEQLESFVKFINERQFNKFQVSLDEVELFLDSNCH
jgi:hypothetical protein